MVCTLFSLESPFITIAWCSSYLYTLEITDWDLRVLDDNKWLFLMIFPFTLIFYNCLLVGCTLTAIVSTTGDGLSSTWCRGKPFRLLYRSQIRWWGGTGLRRRWINVRSWWICLFVAGLENLRPLIHSHYDIFYFGMNFIISILIVMVSL